MRSIKFAMSAAGFQPFGPEWPGYVSRNAERSWLWAAFLTAVALPICARGQSASNRPAVAADYGRLPLSFEPNQGQTDPQVRFTSRGKGYSLFLTDTEAVLTLSKKNPGSLPVKPKEGVNGALRLNGAPGELKTDVVRMQLAGSAPGLKVEGDEQLPGTANYFVGNDPEKWRTSVPTYAKVKYSGVYPGVDLIYYGNQRQLEYDFVVAPGANPKQVKLHFAGAEKLELSADGDLTVLAKNGEIAFHRPAVYQLKGGQLRNGQRVSEPASQREMVEGRFVLLSGNWVGFELGSYDQGRELVIDPTLEYSTYLGGSDQDYATGIAADSAGNSYVTGLSVSTNFPVTTGAYQPTNKEEDSTRSNAFITKLNATGTALVYSTYLGGTASSCSNNSDTLTQGDYGSAIAVDSSGNAYVTGSACAATFPVTKGAFQTTFSTNAVSNAFVTKLNPTGTALVYSTFLGGYGDYYSGDFGNGIAIDSAGDAYVTGQTSSANFPVTKGAYRTTNPNVYGTNSAFVSKLNPTGTSLIYSTYLGGSGRATYSPGDSGSSIAVNSAGNAYITGYTYSNNFPTTPGAFQKTNKAYAIGGSSPFVTELNTTGTALVYSTLIGGSTQGGNPQDSGNGIALDAEGNAYIGGGTSSTDFPTTKGAYQVNHTANGFLANCFITKLNPTGTALVYSTYLGGSGDSSGDRVYALALDALRNVYVTGYTGSSDFPLTSGAYQLTFQKPPRHEPRLLG